jgi:hypothetical protein
MATLDFAPLFRSSVGFDRVSSLVSNGRERAQNAYRPYTSTALQTHQLHCGGGNAPQVSETACIRRLPPQPRSRTLSGRPSCRIYRGRRAWLLEFETASGGWMEPWVRGGRSGFGPKTLVFATLAAAVSYAEWHGYDYRIERPRRHARTSIRRRRGEQGLPRSWLARLSGNGRNGDIYHG